MKSFTEQFTSEICNLRATSARSCSELLANNFSRLFLLLFAASTITSELLKSATAQFSILLLFCLHEHFTFHHFTSINSPHHSFRQCKHVDSHRGAGRSWILHSCNSVQLPVNIFSNFLTFFALTSHSNENPDRFSWIFYNNLHSQAERPTA